MRKVAALAAVAALLAGYLLLGDRRPGAGHPGAGAHARLVDAFDRAAVRRISIGRAGLPSFSLVRQPAGEDPEWREGPGGEAADQAAVEDLLNAIDLAETTRTADVSAAAAGLAPPRVALEIDQPRGPVALELGGPAAGTGVFARVGGAPAICVAPRRLADLADREPWAFRDRRLVPLSPEAIVALSWREGVGNREERRLRLVAGRWQNAHHQPVASERVAESLRRLLDLRVERYAPPRLAPEAPSWIAVETAPGATIRLSIPGDGCAAQPGSRVEREGPSGADGACVAPEVLDDLWRSLEAASAPDLRLVSSPPEAVTRAEIVGDGRRLVLARLPGGAWRFEEPKVGYAADPTVIGDWLAALRGVEARPSPAAGNPKLANQQHVRHLTIDGRTRETAAVSPGDPGYGLVDPEPLRFRDRVALDFAHFDARQLERSAAGQGGERVALTSTDGDRWQVVAPAGAAADRTNVARVIGALGNLRAEAFVPAARAPAGAPELSLVVSIQPPGEAVPRGHTLELYKKKEAPGCTGRLDRDVAFTLAPAACDELRLGLLN
jgi:hypothetical protein